jgi:hypothetical protein
MIYLAGMTYTNNDLSYFFTFKHDQDFISLNVLISKVIKGDLDMTSFFKVITNTNLNQHQMNYLNSFLNAYTY